MLHGLESLADSVNPADTAILGDTPWVQSQHGRSDGCARKRLIGRPQKANAEIYTCSIISTDGNGKLKRRYINRTSWTGIAKIQHMFLVFLGI